MGKIVVSEFISLPGLDGVGGLKDQYEGDILVAGSATLVRGLTDLGLVDEYRLMVFPLILGIGKRLFDGVAMTRLRLADVTEIGADGVSIQRYTRA